MTKARGFGLLVREKKVINRRGRHQRGEQKVQQEEV